MSEIVECSKCGGPRIKGERCKPCRKASKRANNLKNKERKNAQRRQKAAEYPGGSSAYYKAEYKKYAQSRRDFAKKYYREHTEERAEYSRNRRRQNPEWAKEYDAAQYQKRKDYHKQWWSSYSASNKDYLRERDKKRDPIKLKEKNQRRRARLLGCIGFHTQAEWEAVLEAHDYKCAHCGSTSNIAKDHIVPLARGGTHFADNLQPLCRSCNSRKGARPDPYISNTQQAA